MLRLARVLARSPAWVQRPAEPGRPSLGRVGPEPGSCGSIAVSGHVDRRGRTKPHTPRGRNRSNGYAASHAARVRGDPGSGRIAARESRQHQRYAALWQRRVDAASTAAGRPIGSAVVRELMVRYWEQSLSGSG